MEIKTSFTAKREPKKYKHLVSMIISGIKRALEIRQNKLYSKQTELFLQIISTFNPNNTLVFNTTESLFNIPKRNNISGF